MADKPVSETRYTAQDFRAKAARFADDLAPAAMLQQAADTEASLKRLCLKLESADEAFGVGMLQEMEMEGLRR